MVITYENKKFKFFKKFYSYKEYKIFFDKIIILKDKLFEHFFYKSRKILQTYLEKNTLNYLTLKEAIYALRNH